MAAGNIFEGLIVHTYPLPGRHLYADAEQIAEMRERGILLSVPAAELHDLRRDTGRRRSDGSHSALEARGAPRVGLDLETSLIGAVQGERTALAASDLGPI